MGPLNFTDQEFDLILQYAQKFYGTIGSIRCPYFREPIQFNPEGLEHLRRKNWNRGRPRSDQFMRLKFLWAAPEILRLSHTVQGVWHGHDRVRRHRHNQWEEEFKPAIFYEFIAVLKDRRFKVIVKEVEGRGKQFWSLIPFWQQTKQGTRLLHNGNLLED